MDNRLVENLKNYHEGLSQELAEKIVAHAHGRYVLDSPAVLPGRTRIPVGEDFDNASNSDKRTYLINMAVNVSFNPELQGYEQYGSQLIANMFGHRRFEDYDKMLEPTVMDIHSSNEQTLRASEEYNGYPSYCRLFLGRFYSEHCVLAGSDIKATTRIIENELILSDLSGHKLVILSHGEHEFSYSRESIADINGYSVKSIEDRVAGAVSDSDATIDLFVLKSEPSVITVDTLIRISDSYTKPMGIVLNGVSLTGDAKAALDILRDRGHNVLFCGIEHNDNIWDAAQYHILMALDHHDQAKLPKAVSEYALGIINKISTSIEGAIGIAFLNNNSKPVIQYYPVIPDGMQTHSPSVLKRIFDRVITGKTMAVEGIE